MSNTTPNQSHIPDDLGLVRASDVILEETEFLDVEGMKFPKGDLSVLVGMSGVGKSTAWAWIAAAVSNAGKGVVGLNSENSLSTTSARLAAAGANNDFIQLIDPDMLTVFPDDIGRLRSIIDRTATKTGVPVEAVILDPVADIFSVPLGNDQAMRQALRPLCSLAAEYGFALILIGHTLKSVKKSSPKQDVIPGKALANRSRRAYLFGVNPGDPAERAAVCLKDTFGEEDGKGYLFTMDSDIVSDDATGKVVEVGTLTLYDDSAKLFWNDVLRGPEDGEAAGKGGKRTAELLAVATEWLADALAPTLDNPSGIMRSSDLLDQADRDGISKSTLRRAEKARGVMKSRHGGREDIVWWSWLPETDPDRVDYCNVHPDVAADLTDEAIEAAVKATTPGAIVNPGVALSDEDINKLLGGE